MRTDARKLGLTPCERMAGEVVVIAEAAEHVATYRGQLVEVTLVPHKPTVLPSEIAYQLAGPGFTVTEKIKGQFWRRMRLVLHD